MIKFAYTILYVHEVSKSIEFYEKSFGFSRRFISPEGDYGELSVGETTLSFASHKLAKTNLPDGYIESSIEQQTFGVELGFTTSYVEVTLQSAINAGAMLVAAPKIKPWGQTVAYIRDQDGFLIEICTPMGD